MNYQITGKRGFTLIELMIVVAIIGILATISLMAYHQYLDRAKRTVSFSALENFRKQIANYMIDKGNYPTTIDFTTCTDQDGNQIIPAMNCSYLKQDVFAIDSYTLVNGTYTVLARAGDSGHTALRLTEDSVIIITP